MNELYILGLGDTILVDGESVILNRWEGVGDDCRLGNGRYVASLALLGVQGESAHYRGRMSVMEKARGIPLVGRWLVRYLAD